MAVPERPAPPVPPVAMAVLPWSVELATADALCVPLPPAPPLTPTTPFAPLYAPAVVGSMAMAPITGRAETASETAAAVATRWQDNILRRRMIILSRKAWDKIQPKAPAAPIMTREIAGESESMELC